MSRLEEMRQSRESYSVAFMAFVKAYGEDSAVLVCFFEGKDVQYFGPRLDMVAPGMRWEPVNCGGKKAVLRNHELITKHTVYRNARVAFFVDHDYGLDDVPLDSGRVYCTPCYSVENLYATKDVFERVLKAEFDLPKFPDSEGCFSRNIKSFCVALERFIEVAELLNQWVFVQRRHERDNGLPRQLDAAKLRLSQMFIIELDRVEGRYTIFDLEAASGCVTPCDPVELDGLVKAAATPDRHRRMRGKFLAFFVREYFTKLAVAANVEGTAHFSEKRKVSLRPSGTNFLSELSQYADTPECLINFIRSLQVTASDKAADDNPSFLARFFAWFSRMVQPITSHNAI